RARLILALTNILGLARVKNDGLALPELHRDLTRQLRNNGRLLDLLQPRSEILVRDRQITGIKNGHYRILSFQASLTRRLRMYCRASSTTTIYGDFYCPGNNVPT